MSNVFSLGNGESRLWFNLEDLRPYGMIYGCNALYRDFIPDVLVAVDPTIHNEILATDYIENNKVCFRETVTPPNKRYSNVDDVMVEDIPVPWEHPNVTKVQDVIENYNFEQRAGHNSALKIGFSSGPQATLLGCCLENPSDVYLIGHDIISLSKKINNVYKDTVNYGVSSDEPTPGVNWIDHLKIIFEEWSKVNFWHVGPLKNIKVWEGVVNIQPLSISEMWKRLNSETVIL